MNNFDNFSNEKTNPFQANSTSFEFDIDEKFYFGTDETETRLNDYDSNLLSEDAYKKLDDEVFKLEYKINRLEKKLNLITSQLKGTNALGDEKKFQHLMLKKQQYEYELQRLYQMYREQSLPTNMAERIIQFVLAIPIKSTEILKRLILNIKQSSIIKNLSKFYNKTNFQDTLLMLESINKNVDELVSMRAPYGEPTEKYDQLLGYLNKANHIQSQISQITKK